ncbi:MAG: histone H1 [Dehalococcoidia bacterium]
MDKKPHRPRDPNQLAKMIVDLATGEAEEPREPTPDEQGKDPHAVALGKRGGKRGGVARAESLTPEQRSQIARKAAQARWKSDR